MAQRIAVIDYGMGNLRSVSKAIEHVAEASDQVLVTDNPDLILSADRVVFPSKMMGQRLGLELVRPNLLEQLRLPHRSGAAKIIAHQSHDHNHTRGTGNNNRDDGGDESIPRADKNSRCHDRGYTATVAQHAGNDGRTVQTDFVHKAVHQKRDARQITNVFNNGQADEKGEQVGQDNGYAADNTGERAVQNSIQQAALVERGCRCLDKSEQHLH